MCDIYLRKKISVCLALILLIFCLGACGAYTSSLNTETDKEISEDGLDALAGVGGINAGITPFPGLRSNADKTKSEEIDSVETPFDSPSVNEKGSSLDNEPVVTVSAKGLDVKIELFNSWETGGRYYSHWNGTIKNNTEKSISSWAASREFPNGTVLSDSWNGNYSFKDNVLHINNVDYNGSLAKGESTEFGFIVHSSVAIKNTDSVVASGVAGDIGSEGELDMPVPPGAFEPAKITDKKTADWLYAKGNKLYTENGQEVWITGINWFGYNTGTNTFDGLWEVNFDDTIKAVADRGFNMLRVPISAELIRDWSKGVYPRANYNNARNSHFNDRNSLEIFDYVVNACRANGMKIMIDIHSAKTDQMGHMKNMWYEGDITEKVFIDALAWMAKRYKDDDTVIAYDLKNEPHGKPNESPRAKWDDSKDSDNWKYVAEKAAGAILKENPNVLIVVEGIEIYPRDIQKNPNFTSKNDGDYHFNWWGGNLRGVKDNPIDLGEFQNKLVYSPHDYGPTVHRQPWFYDGYDYNSLYRDCWRDNWMFIYEDETAPLLIGEWGGFMTEPNLTWMTHFRKLIETYRLHHTFWCLNENSGDTGGLLKNNFTSWDEEKYEFLKPVLWQHNGKFVGLSHDVPLGSNGMSLNEYIKANQ